MIPTSGLKIDGVRIEAEIYGPTPEHAPTLVLLHEGLGCVAMWRDFPRLLAERTGYGVLVYSRAGYGRSDPVRLPRPLTYMHDEALRVLPAVLDQTGINKCILVGHSDGASIASIYAGSRQDFRIRGLVLMAPHFFVEEATIRAIAAAKRAFETTDLRARLEKYHGLNVDVAFWGWNAAWLDPGFRSWRIDDYLAYIRVPMLIIQGADDQYGTPAQVTAADAATYCPLEILMLDRCGHAPHVDQPKATMGAIAEFVARILAFHEGLRGVA
jgi:pimeloyl-ACP methyl ester carboxylesterase